jgi:hypothetical protein
MRPAALAIAVTAINFKYRCGQRVNDPAREKLRVIRLPDGKLDDSELVHTKPRDRVPVASRPKGEWVGEALLSCLGSDWR